jgi:hypothetical protein
MNLTFLIQMKWNEYLQKFIPCGLKPEEFQVRIRDFPPMKKKAANGSVSTKFHDCASLIDMHKKAIPKFDKMKASEKKAALEDQKTKAKEALQGKVLRNEKVNRFSGHVSYMT